MEAAVAQVISGSDAAAAATAAVLLALKERQLTVLGLVALLKDPFTDDIDHEGRARAVQLLSQVAAEVPESLQPGDVEVIAEFLGSKLQDWRCVGTTASGCLALLTRHRQPHLAQLPQAAGVSLIRRLMAVHVQGLDYKGRMTCYQLLLEVLQGPYAVDAVLGGADLVNFTVVAMENEADPRCLLLALQCVQAVGALYQQPFLAQVNHLDEGLEDLFDVGVVPYFPMMFTPPKNDTHHITREQLLEAVTNAMGCCPQFAALGIPLISEKMGSALKQAKFDAIKALPFCLTSWGPAAVQPHMQAVWLMLKAELMAPAAAESLLADQLMARHTTAAAAAAALSDSISALGPGLLDKQVLADVAIEDLLQYLGLANPPWEQKGLAVGSYDNEGPTDAIKVPAGEGWDLPERAQKRLTCIANIIAAVAAAGGASCSAACAEVLEPAVTAVLYDSKKRSTPQLPSSTGGIIVQGSGNSSSDADSARLRPIQADCGVLCVLHNALKAVAAIVISSSSSDGPNTTIAEGTAGHPYAAVAELVPKVADALVQLQQQLEHWAQQQQQAAGVDALDVAQRDQLQLWVLLVWQDLFTLPRSVAPVQQQQADAAAEQLLKLALQGNSIEVELQMGARLYCSIQAAAATALTNLAQWPVDSLDSAAHAAAAAAGDTGNVAAAHTACGMRSLAQHVVPSLLDMLQRGIAKCGGSTNAVDAVSANEQALSITALNLIKQLAGSGAAAAWHVLQWLQSLVLQQVKQGAWVSLVTTLCILHTHCTPALPATLDNDSSAATALFCQSLLEAWQQQQQQPAAAAWEACMQARYHSCLLLAHLTAKCSIDSQRQLVLTGCEWVSTYAAQLAAKGAGQANGPVCLAASVLAATRPGLLMASSVVDLVRTLAAACVASSNTGNNSSHGSAGQLDSAAAGIALAAIVNKCCGYSKQRVTNSSSGGNASAADSATAGGVTPDQLLTTVLPALQDNRNTAGALTASAWLAMGLAMQRHDGWQQLMQQVLHLLSSMQLPHNTIVHEVGDQQLMWAAAEFFTVLVTSSLPSSLPAAAAAVTAGSDQQQQQQPAGQSSEDNQQLSIIRLGLHMSQHLMARPLWQQKAFNIALNAIMSDLDSGSQTHARNTAAAQEAFVSSKQAGSALWLATACLLSASSTAVTAAAMEQVVPVLLRCLTQLLDMWRGLATGNTGSSSDSADSSSSSSGASLMSVSGASTSELRMLQLLHSCLLLVADVLMACKQAAALLENHVDQLLSILCQLLRLNPLPVAINQAAMAAAADPLGAQPSAARHRQQLVSTAAALREVAVLCLTSVVGLPYHLLHPYRRQVLAAVTAALDDDRRAVRKAAVVCRASWTMS